MGFIQLLIDIITKIKYIMFKIIAFFIITLLAQLNVRVDILFSYREHLHVCVISLRGEALVHKASIAPSLFIVVSLSSQESVRSFTYVLRESILNLSTIFLLDFGAFSTVFFFFHFCSTMLSHKNNFL